MLVRCLAALAHQGRYQRRMLLPALPEAAY